MKNFINTIIRFWFIILMAGLFIALLVFTALM